MLRCPASRPGLEAHMGAGKVRYGFASAERGKLPQNRLATCHNPFTMCSSADSLEEDSSRRAGDMSSMKKLTKLKTSRDFWSSLTDNELLQARFTTAEPENLKGIVLEVPVSTAYPFVEFIYDLSDRERLARCVHCGYENHYHGFVMRTENGERFLVGIDCGRKIYGADWEAFQKDFNFARTRQALLANLVGLRRELPRFVEFLAELAGSEVLTQYFVTRRHFRSTLLRLHGKLQMAVSRGGGILSVDETIRDYEAEARDEARYERKMVAFERETVTEQKRLREHGLKPTKPRKPLFMTATRQLGVIGTPRFFGTQPALKKDVDAILEQFEALGTLIDESKSNQEMVTIVRQVGALLDRVKEIIGLLGELADFFQPQRLALVARWANTHNDIPGSYRALERGIERTSADGEKVSVVLPLDYSVPDIAPILALRSAMYERSS